MNVVIRYRDGVIFNPDCIYADERSENYREKGRLVAKKGLDYYTLQEYKTHLEAVSHLNQIIEEYLQLKYFSIIDLQDN